MIFDRTWALAVLDQALNLMQVEFEQSGRAQLFEQLHPFLEGEPGALSYHGRSTLYVSPEGTSQVTIGTAGEVELWPEGGTPRRLGTVVAAQPAVLTIPDRVSSGVFSPDATRLLT